VSVDNFLLSASATDLNYPEIRPSLDLNFARTKTLDPRITFTRSSGGSYVGADGLIKYAGVNEARFDHNPVTGESLGLLIEEQRTNVVTYSEDLGNSWIKANVTTAVNSTTAPDGTLTADSILTSLAGVTNSYLVQVVSLGLSTYTFSFYAKGSTSRSSAFIDQFGIGGVSTRARGSINLTSGVVTYINFGSGNSISATNVGNGWWRCQTTFNVTVAGTIEIRIGNSNIDEIYVWGAQVELGSFPTSYIPTVASTVTRAADVAQITGTNFSSWYRQDEGTVFVENNQSAITGDVSYSYYIDAGSGAANSIYSGATSSNMRGSVFSGNVVQCNSFYSGGISAGVQAKTAFGLKQNQFGLVLNGGTVVSDKSGTMPAGINRMVLGNNAAISAAINGTIKRLTYWPKRLPNSQLQALTR